MSVDEVLGEVVPALNKAREQGKTRFIGFTAIGDTEALHARDRVPRVRHRAGALQRAQSRARARRCRPPIRRRISDRSSIAPRRPVSAPSASACSRAARCRVARRAIRSARRWSSRSARVRATPRTPRGRAGSTPWCAKATPPASPRWRYALPSPTASSRPPRSGSPISTSSRPRSVPSRWAALGRGARAAAAAAGAEFLGEAR